MQLRFIILGLKILSLYFVFTNITGIGARTGDKACDIQLSFNELDSTCIDSILSMNGFSILSSLTISEKPETIPPFSSESNESLKNTMLVHTSRSGKTKESKAEDVLKRMAMAIDIEEEDLQLYWFSGIDCESSQIAFPEINTSKALAMYFDFENGSIYLKSLFSDSASQ